MAEGYGMTEPSSPVPFILVTGFLGSGKTTLLKRYISRYADVRRVAVIQNEFAEAGVDGEELRRTGKSFEILEINRGSVFCVCLLSDFVSSLSELVERVHPQVVVLEATGLADPIAVGQLLHAPELRQRVYLQHVYCIVDTVTFPKMVRAVSRVSHQVRIADTVLLNKCDVEGADPAVVEELVRGMNPFARILQTRFCDITFDEPGQPGPGPTVSERLAQGQGRIESCGRPEIGSAAARRSQPVAREALNRFLARMVPGSYRLKGFVKLQEGGAVAVQSCFGATSVVDVQDYNGASELVAMGPGVEPELFVKEFERC